MTRGISEERLKDIWERLDRHVLNVERDLIRDLIRECKELNPWQPIDENTPKGRQLLVKFDDGLCEVAKLTDLGWFSNDGLDFAYGFDIPTHWQELPDDPKVKNK